ncbi:G-protein coupled receptor 39-like [Carcharodon carcharias]|uniref:G-protein coupled receptor 39-like n=1 Tax=Carcharodon carcharias TaxID=13397 RepID=UPI001B7F1115|nr:G-protein coupled receptor 39-like [Carcharodon carcharias]
MNATGEEQWTGPGNVPPGFVLMTPAVKMATSVVYGTIFISGMIGNLLAIRVIWALKGQACKQSLSHHMVSMACSDLFILTLALPIELYGIIWCPYPWPIGNVGCKGFYLLWEICSYATIFNVLTFSFQRYLAICHPMLAKVMVTSRTKRLIGLVWGVAAITGLPVTFAVGVEDAWKPFRSGTETLPPLYICTNISGRKVIFELVIYISFSLYILVLLFVAFTCRQMIKTLLKDRPLPIALKRTNAAGKVLSKPKAIRRQNVVMLGCIVAVLAICWLPFQAKRLMTAVKSKTQWTEYYYRSYLAMQPITNTFYYLSSAINPFLYNVTSKQFRKVFVQVLRDFCQSSSVPSKHERNSQLNLKQESTSLIGRPSLSKIEELKNPLAV